MITNSNNIIDNIKNSKEEDNFIECVFCNNFFPFNKFVICDLCNFFFCLKDYEPHFNIYHPETKIFQTYNTDYFEYDNNNNFYENNIYLLENNKNIISNENINNLNSKCFNENLIKKVIDLNKINLYNIDDKNFLNHIENYENLNHLQNKDNIYNIKNKENLDNNENNLHFNNIKNLINIDNNLKQLENKDNLIQVKKNENFNQIKNKENLNEIENNYNLNQFENKEISIEIKNNENLNQIEINKLINYIENNKILNNIENEKIIFLIKYYEDLLKDKFNNNIFNKKFFTEYYNYLKKYENFYHIKYNEDLYTLKLYFYIFIKKNYIDYFNKNENYENFNYLLKNNDLLIDNKYFNINEINKNFNLHLENKQIIDNKDNYNNIFQKDLLLYINKSNEYLILNSKCDILNLCETCGFPCYLYLIYERFLAFSYFNIFLIKKCKFKHIKKFNLNSGLNLDLKCEKCNIINSKTKYYYIIKTKQYLCQKCFFKENFFCFKLKKNIYLDISNSKKIFEQKLEYIKNKYNRSLDYLEKLNKNFLNLIENNCLYKDFNLLYRELNLFIRKNKNLLYLSKILLEKYEKDLNHNCITKEINESFKNILNFNIKEDFSNFTKEKLLNTNNIIEELLSKNNLLLNIFNNIPENKNIKILDFSLVYLTFIKILKNGNLLITFSREKKIYIQIYKYPFFYEENECLFIDNSNSFNDKITNIFELLDDNLIIQTKKNYLYFLNESELFTKETFPYLYIKNLIKIIPTKTNIFYTIVKDKNFYMLKKYINMDIVNSFQLQIPFKIDDAFYFKNYDIVFFYEIVRYSNYLIYNDELPKLFYVYIGNFNIKSNIINHKRLKVSFVKSFIKLKNNMILLQSSFITIINVNTLQIISIIQTANEYINLKYLNYNTILAIDKKKNFIHIDSLMNLKEIGKQKINFDFYDIHILKNGFLFLKYNNILEIHFEIL